MKRGFGFSGMVLLLLAVGCATEAPPPPPPPAPLPPARINFDSHCYQIDGRDTFIYSASFHYFRCPKALWADRFQTLKDAGFNTVDTYVPWNWHERQPPTGVDDFSQMNMTDLTAWLDMAVNQFGFNVILRPGPYICGEWDGGGYPQWLVTRRPTTVREGRWLRSDDPVYLKWCRHWYQAVARAAAPYQITSRPPGKPGIILWQIENEYMYASFQPDVKQRQLLALAHDARDFGIEVPLITCMSDDPLFRQNPYLLQNVTECRNSYPGYDPESELHNITMLDDYQPDKPRMITELQGGWFSEVGPDKKLSVDQGFTAEQITHITLLAWAHGYSGTNFYMGFGGTNFGDWAASGITTSYDYDAPVREWGGVGDRYYAVQSLGALIRTYGPSLARSDAESIDSGNAPDDLTVICRKGADGARFIFLLNDRRSEPLSGKLTLTIPDDSTVHLALHYDLKPFGAEVLYLPPGATDAAQGAWYPSLPAQPMFQVSQPTQDVPVRMCVRADPGPAESSWMPLPDGAGVEDVGIFDRRFVWYRADLTNVERGKKLLLSAALPRQDTFIAQLDGKRLDIQRRGSRLVGGWIPPLTDGPHSLQILYENGGRPNSGPGMEARCGLHDPSISEFRFLPITIDDWSMRPANQRTGDWNWIDIADEPKQVKAHETAVFRGRFKMTQEDLDQGAAILSLDHIQGTARLTVNGNDFGELKKSQNIGSALQAGENIVLITVMAGDSSGGIGGGAEIDSTISAAPLPLTWEISGHSAGLAEKWFALERDDSDWQSVGAGDGTPLETADSIQPVWVRLHFQIPTSGKWFLHLDATGNGFIYLNGHDLGRYWEFGPQKDFFLPECWLNPSGADSDNQVTLCLRPTDGPVTVKAAAVKCLADN